MKFIFPILFIVFFVFGISAQAQDRVEVSGRIIVNIDDLQNVTIFNASSNKGTITDSLGNFTLKVALYDQIKVSAIQLIPFKTKITQQVIDNKQLNIFLAERVNSLEEVVLLEFGLTGDLKTDVDTVRVFKPLDFSFGSFNDFEMPDDYHSNVENIAIGTQNDRQRYQFNGMAIIGLIANAIFKNKNKKKKKQQDYKNKMGSQFEVPVSFFSEKFNDNYFVKNYNIPKDKVLNFIAFLEAETFNKNLLNPEREFELVDYINKKSKQFLNSNNEKK